MTQWERLNLELTRKRKSWASLAAYLGLKKQNVGNWKARGIPAKHLRKCAEFVSRTHDWLDIGEDDVPTNDSKMQPVQSGETVPEFKPNNTLTHTEQAQPATNNEATISQTLERLGALLAKADSKTRNDVAALLLRYAQDPAEGKRLAQAIEILLGGPPP